MSVLDELKKLDKQRAELLANAKQEAVKKAEAAVAELNALGFNFSLKEAGVKGTGSRRSGIRQEVLATVKAQPNGISRADLLDTLNAKGDTSAEQSVSNALSALKKNGSISGEDGIYKAI